MDWMDWNDIAIMVGGGISLAGAIASTPAIFRRWRRPGQKTHLMTTVPLASVGELGGQAAFMGGAALVQSGVLAHDLQRGASHQWLAFLLATSALMLLLCGVALGKLSLRWHMRPGAAPDEVLEAGAKI